MSAITVHDNNINIVYAPAISGYDSNFWERYYGASDPTINGSDQLVMNADGIASKVFYRYLDAEFCVTVPTAPTSGNQRRWGFYNPNMGNRGRIEFNISGAVFSIIVYSSGGNLIAQQTIDWDDTNWTNKPVVFKIVWKESGIIFSVGTFAGGLVTGALTLRKVARVALQGHDINVGVPKIGSPVHVRNEVADNMLVDYIGLRNVQSQG